MESRETREKVSRQFNWTEISTRMLRILKNTSFYRLFGHNHPIETIDGYDETSTMDRFGNIAIVGSEMEGPDVSLEMRYKTHGIALLGLRSDGRDALRQLLITTVIILLISHVRLMRSGGPFTRECDRCTLSRVPPDPTRRERPRHLHV